MDAPFLSVTVLTYNRADTLAQTLESLMRQLDRSDVELLVSDNASTDNTSEVLSSYAQKISNLRIHRNPDNLGFDGNVAAALSHANGEYVAFFSDDDIAPSSYLADLLGELRRTRPEILYINHAPFFHNDVSHLGSAFLPRRRCLSDSGSDFIFEFGLGFISALVLKRTSALPFVRCVKMNCGCAHLDLSYRVALTTTGPFVFNGELCAYARYTYAGQPILEAGPLNQARLLRTLETENLITAAALNRYFGQLTIHVLPRHVFIARARGGGVPFTTLRETFGSRASLYLAVAPFYLLPRPLLRILYHAGKAMVHLIRRGRFR